jgi:hypothetical protein
MHPDQIGALSDCDFATISKAHGLGRRLGHGPDRGGQVDRPNMPRQL